MARGLVAGDPDRYGRVRVRGADGRAFELYEFEWKMAQWLDGTQGLTDLAERAKALGIAATERSIASWISELSAYGFVDRGTQSQGSKSSLETSMEDRLQQGDCAGAWRLFMDAHQVVKSPSLASLARITAGLETLRADAMGEDPPIIPAHVTDPGPEDAKRLVEPIASLLSLGRLSEAGVFVELMRMLQPASPDVERFDEWMRLGIDPNDQISHPTGGSTEPNLSLSLTPNSAKRGRILPRALRQILPFAIVASFIVALAATPFQLTVTEPAILRPEVSTTLHAPLDAVIDELMVSEGQVVQRGQRIAVLRRDDLPWQLRAALAEVEGARSALEDVRNSPRPGELAQARARVAASRVALAAARREHRRTRALQAKGVASVQETEVAELEVLTNERELSQARAALDLLVAGPPPQRLRALEAEVHKQQQRVNLLEQQLAERTLEAPHDGVVLTERIHEREGLRVNQGDPIARIGQLDTLLADVAVPEADVDAIALGQEVHLRLRAFPGREYTGEVVAIAPQTAEDPTTESDPDDPTERVDKVIWVRARIPNHDGRLRQHMAGWVEIKGDELSVLGVMTRRLLRWFRTRLVL